MTVCLCNQNAFSTCDVMKVECTRQGPLRSKASGRGGGGGGGGGGRGGEGGGGGGGEGGGGGGL